MLDQAGHFLNELLVEANQVHLDLINLVIDHIAYSTSMSEEYDSTLSKFLKSGQLVREVNVGGRRVAVIKLNDPIIWRSKKINAVELLEPKAGEPAKTGWEHVEFLVDDFDNTITKYPSVNWITKDKDRQEFARTKIILDSGEEIKFLKKPILSEA